MAEEDEPESGLIPLLEEGPSEEELLEAQTSVVDPLEDLRKVCPDIIVGAEAVDTLAARPAHFVWGNMVVSGTINLISGKPGSGKSTLLFLLLSARIRIPGYKTSDVLGHSLESAHGMKFVVLISEQYDAGTCRKLVKVLMKVTEISESKFGDRRSDSLKRLIIIARKEAHTQSAIWRAIGKLVARGRISDIFVDTLATVTPPTVGPQKGGGSNSEEAQVKLFGDIAKTIERAPRGPRDEPDRYKPTVWINHHNRKGEETGELDDVSGSGQRTAQSDTVMIVRATRNKRTKEVLSSTITFSKLREEPDVWPEPIKWALERGKPEVKKDARGGARESSGRKDKSRDRVLEVLQSDPNRVWGIRDLRAKTGLNGARASEILGQLIEEGLVEKSAHDSKYRAVNSGRRRK